MSLNLSIIICTHNPREDYLRRTLEALRGQTLPKEQWELLLIDNASEEPLESRWNLDWHPHGRHVREDKLGLTPARLRGIGESGGELFVFVDDDNVLSSDYLERALEIDRQFPFLGAWGGSLIPRYEVEPQDWALPYVSMLALREVKRDQWSNKIDSMETCPAGAGMVIRASVARRYLEIVKNDFQRVGLDRKGTSLMSCGDLDMAYTSCDMGMGTGVFKSLSAEHLIPPGRLEKSYLLRLAEANGYSRVLLNNYRDRSLTPTRIASSSAPKRLGRAIIDWFRCRVGSQRKRLLAQFQYAQRKGKKRGLELLQKMDSR